jgi:hypothetical protein
MYIFGANFGVRRECVLHAGGFHPDGFPKSKRFHRGDGETHVSQFVTRNGGKVSVSSLAWVLHEVSEGRKDLSYFYKRAFDSGIGFSFVFLRKLFLPPHNTVPLEHGPLDKPSRFPKFELEAFIRFPFFLGGWAAHSGLFLVSKEMRRWVLRPSYLA